MSAADGFLTPPLGGGHAELERRYQRLLRLYPRDFRARRETEMLGVLMASARHGQARPTRGDVTDIVKGSLIARLSGPRGGWAPALAAFALLAPLFLVLTDILQVAFPYWESQAGWEARVRSMESDLRAGKSVPPAVFEHWHIGGSQLLSQPSDGFLLLAVGHVLVAAAVLAGRRRTALATLVVVAAVDLAQWNGLGPWILLHFHGRAADDLAMWMWPPVMGGRSIDPSLTLPYTVELVTITVFLLEAVALIAADPRAARRQANWWLAAPLLILAVGVQAWAFAFDSVQDWATEPLAVTAGFVFAVIALVLPLALGLGWRAALLLAAVCYPCALGVAWTFAVVVHPNGYYGDDLLGNLTPTHLLALYLPPLLVACWGAARTLRAAKAWDRGKLA